MSIYNKRLKSNFFFLEGFGMNAMKMWKNEEMVRGLGPSEKKETASSLQQQLPIRDKFLLKI